MNIKFEKMKNEFVVKSLGTIESNDGFVVKLKSDFIPALRNITGFSHLQVIWWGNKTDDEKSRSVLSTKKPYKKSPEELGIFATRSQFRPNPVLITTVAVLDIDFDKGLIYIPYIDADPGTPVLDIKPYHKLERVADCCVPDWCSHWPESYEQAASFNWEDEFNF
ncbi:MAG TPA: TrmO family methyltransferase [Bacteroidales bacterium]|nr:TrmO family methyltransferase [Bacteroidales bacterium]